MDISELAHDESAQQIYGEKGNEVVNNPTGNANGNGINAANPESASRGNGNAANVNINGVLDPGSTADNNLETTGNAGNSTNSKNDKASIPESSKIYQPTPFPGHGTGNNSFHRQNNHSANHESTQRYPHSRIEGYICLNSYPWLSRIGCKSPRDAYFMKGNTLNRKSPIPVIKAQFGHNT